MKKRVFYPFILSVSVFILTGYLVTRFTYSILQEEKKIIAIGEVFTSLDKLRIAFRSALTSHQHYLLTNKDTHREEYRAQVEDMNGALQELRETEYAYFFPENKIDELDSVLMQEVRILNSILTMIDHSDWMEIQQVIEERSVPLINEIRAIAENKSQDLESLQRNLKRKTRRDILNIIVVLSLGFVAGLLFILYAFKQMQNENRARRRTEHELRRSSEELRQTNWTKDMFFSIIAHDLRSPFSSLLNLFDLLNEALASKDISMIEENIASIEFSARRTYNLLQNLLDWSRLQTGRLHFSPEYFNLNEIIEENLDLYAEAARQRSLQLLYSKLDMVVFADKNMINTVIRNLMGNALKFTNEGSIEVNVEKTNGWVQVSIRDTGIGIARADLEKLFKIEVNTASIGNSREKGSGLGLILCKNFIEINQGDIRVASEPDQGSVFSFTLPIRRK